MNMITTIDETLAQVPAPIPGDYHQVKKGKVGVLLVNLGTPDGTDAKSMRRYLREFLSDPRVIDMPKVLWYPILYGIALNTIPKKSGETYKKIWNTERDESPLRTYTRGQAEKLAEMLCDLPDVIVDWGMRYGNPSIKRTVEKLIARGCDRIIMFPLYPQFSATTTATASDQLFRTLMKIRAMPSVRTVPAYYDEPVYIEALTRSIEQHLVKLDFEPKVILTSYHGIPKTYSERGDPYHCHCVKTTRLLRESLGMDDKRLMTTFQSRFGSQEWLQPYTNKTVKRLAKESVESIAIVNPGFSADCIETLEEIAVENAKIFHNAGGKKFSHIPCLNDSPEGMAVIVAITRRELMGWV